MTELVRGARDVARGFAFLNKHPRLWGYVVAPAMVTAVILIGIVVTIMATAGSLVALVTAWMPDRIAAFADWLVWGVVLTGLVLGGLLVFVSVAGVLAGPFSELLSEQIEEQVTGRPAPGFSAAAFVRGAIRGIGHALRRLVVLVLGAALLFALGLIPVVGTIAALAIGGYIAARGAAYDSYDAVMSRRDLAYRAKVVYLAKRRPRTLGLGATVAAMLFVPGLNLVALGLGAAGATLAALDDERARPAPDRPVAV